ncbi:MULTISPECIES: ribonuclease P protein component [Bacillaceae]|uniref:Ribonuclease P protein component n=1 Tax=Domibacillus aminovorans TaxID=29332 RepID=A0A177KZG4_9BACI|nr:MULTISPECIES: ribonuclease P protein component [Bacillaceae]OAH54255.1 ribonuclease P protein component [Domibacillus aminovorans]OAH58733.1 ribonuclease P protein component [Domibacillus aminovorans]
MKKSFRIKKNDDFQMVFSKGKSFANRQFVVYMHEKKQNVPFRIGLSVSKKVGNAVVRNRIKRYIRQSFMDLKTDVSPGYEFIIIARKPAADMTCNEVKSSLMHVLKLAKAL